MVTLTYVMMTPRDAINLLLPPRQRNCRFVHCDTFSCCASSLGTAALLVACHRLALPTPTWYMYIVPGVLDLYQLNRRIWPSGFQARLGIMRSRDRDPLVAGSVYCANNRGDADVNHCTCSELRRHPRSTGYSLLGVRGTWMQQSVTRFRPLSGTWL